MRIFPPVSHPVSYMVLASVLLPLPALAQNADAEALEVCEAAEAHYVAARALDMESIVDQHTPDFTFFTGDGALLWTFDSLDEQRSEFERDPTLDIQKHIRHCDAQVYGDAGVATYYLTGSITTGGQTATGTWRVTEVWVKQGGDWKEAHHHESPLLGAVLP